MGPTRRSLLFALVSSAIFVTAVAAPALGASRTTVYVDDDGRGTATSCSGNKVIPDRLPSFTGSSAVANTTYMVCPGTYVGDVLVQSADNVRIVAVERWHATIVAPPDQNNGSPLVSVLFAPNFVIKGMRLVAPTSGTCDRVGAMIAINTSPNSSVLSNHIEPLGKQSLDACGYLRGIFVSGGSDGTHVYWNRVRDFIDFGIDVGPANNAVIRGNRINYFHAAYSAGLGGGIGILLNQEATGVRVAKNTIRGLNTGGVSTPRFSEGIEDNTLPALIRNNSVANVDTGIQLLSVTAGRVEANKLVSGVGTGIALYITTAIEVLNNNVTAQGAGMYANQDTVSNNIHDNNFNGSGDPDCQDLSTGSGTSGTANTWTNDLGHTSNPAGLCQDPSTT